MILSQSNCIIAEQGPQLYANHERIKMLFIVDCLAYYNESQNNKLVTKSSFLGFPQTLDFHFCCFPYLQLLVQTSYNTKPKSTRTWWLLRKCFEFCFELFWASENAGGESEMKGEGKTSLDLYLYFHRNSDTLLIDFVSFTHPSVGWRR